MLIWMKWNEIEKDNQFNLRINWIILNQNEYSRAENERNASKANIKPMPIIIEITFLQLSSIDATPYGDLLS